MNIHLICVPYQLDVARWAYALGPQTFLDHGLPKLCERLGHKLVHTTWIELAHKERSRDVISNIARIAGRTSIAVAAALSDPDGLAIALEGDCSHAVGVIGGLARAAHSPGVVWFDAHGDLHTYSTTTTGYVGGMPLATALGWDSQDWRLEAGLKEPVPPQAVALIGASDLDPEEIEAIEAHRIARLDADFLTDNAATLVSNLLAPLRSVASAWYVHLDVDVAGPLEVPGGLTPTPRPLQRDALRSAVRAATGALQVYALSLATYNPSGDPELRGVQLGLDMLEAMLIGISESPRGRSQLKEWKIS
jgi:arginase